MLKRLRHLEYVIISNPYERAILTINDLAIELKINIKIEHDLRERQLAGEEHVFTRRRIEQAGSRTGYKYPKKDP
jgi:hypothetical protein